MNRDFFLSIIKKKGAKTDILSKSEKLIYHV